jgi:hypothetical protein
MLGTRREALAALRALGGLKDVIPRVLLHHGDAPRFEHPHLCVEPEGAFLSRWVEDAAACLATVSRIEVPAFPRWHLLDETRRAAGIAAR